METEVRSQIEKMVQSARKLLEQELKEQLEGTYGLHKNGTLEDISALPQIKDNHDALKARNGFEYFINNETSRGTKKKDAVDKLVLGLSFTHLNRLIALKLMERRKVIKESVSRKTDSNGFKFFIADYPEQMALWTSGKNDEVYKNFLLHQYGLISEEIHVLFDPEDVSNLIFPRPRALNDLLDLINQEALSDVWEEDETIGWIYQYFTPKELRKQARSESSVPRNSYELAFRNQFYTPRYVVRFLTDNTLGRTWYEMRQGDTSLTETCEYMVRRPKEIFLQEGEEAPEIEEESDKTQKELLNEPFYIPYRAKKDPRELKILDPAVGSGHFLLYCFDVLVIIYEEAFEDPDLSSSLKADYPTIDEYREAIPGLILRHNLHGIDIDLRATQIASLALWLRAQKAYQETGIRASKRPKITKSNIVCAETMPGNEAVLREFKKNLKPAVLGDFVTDVWNEMRMAGEAGSLLKIEETITNLVKEAKEAWLTRPKEIQLDLFGNKKFVEQMHFNLRGIKEEIFWEEAEDMLISSLKSFAEEASNGDSYPRKLFAENAAHGFAFIDVINKKYDVVLMNPPFGAASEKASNYLTVKYDSWNKNILCAFFIRAMSLLSETGLMGVIYDRTAAIKSTYEEFRIKYILKECNIFSVADTGWEVLEANVETSTIVLDKKPKKYFNKGSFFDILNINSKEKGEVLHDVILSHNNGCLLKNTFLRNQFSFLKLPNAIIGYNMPSFVLNIFDKNPSFKDAGFVAYQGHALEAERFYRLFWELKLGNIIGTGRKWTFAYKGGDYSLYYLPIQNVALYGNKGEIIPKSTANVLRNVELHHKTGVSWGKRGKFVDAHILPQSHIFTMEGPAIPLDDKENVWFILGLINSNFFQYIINLYCGQHKTNGYVNLFPLKKPEIIIKNKISELTERAFSIKYNWYYSDETNFLFSIPWLLKTTKKSSSISEKLRDIISEECYLNEKYYAYVSQINELILRQYELKNEMELIDDFCKDRENDKVWFDKTGLSEKTKHVEHLMICISYFLGCVFGRWDIRLSLEESLIPKLPDPFDILPICPPGMLIGPDGLPAKEGQIVSEEWIKARESIVEIQENFLSPTIFDDEYPLKIDWDGILVDDPGHIDDIVGRVKDVFELVWGDNVQDLEKEVCEILKVKSLRELFQKKFFDFHINMYSKSRRKAPIYWQLSSKNKNYSLWIYYHRLTSDTLFLALRKYIDPKVGYEETRLDELKQKLDSERGSLPISKITAKEKEIEKKSDFIVELKELRDKLEEIAQRGYDPDFDDGVILNMAPLHEVILWKEPAKYWKELEEGKYDWAHIAMKYWPERVKEKCRTDKSLAIAHGLEELYDGDSN